MGGLLVVLHLVFHIYLSALLVVLKLDWSFCAGLGKLESMIRTVEKRFLVLFFHDLV